MIQDIARTLEKNSISYKRLLSKASEFYGSIVKDYNYEVYICHSDDFRSDINMCFIDAV